MNEPTDARVGVLCALGAFAYREPIGAAQLATFGFVWAGCLLYTADALRARQPAAASV